MVAPEYSPLVVDHFEHPRNFGRLAAAPDVIEARAGSREQGIVFNFSARITDDVIKEVRAQVFGCPHCVAAGSWLSERLRGIDLAGLTRWSWREAAAALEIPAEKRGRFLILEDVVHALAAVWRHKT